MAGRNMHFFAGATGGTPARQINPGDTVDMGNLGHVLIERNDHLNPDHSPEWDGPPELHGKDSSGKPFRMQVDAEETFNRVPTAPAKKKPTKKKK